MAPRFPKQASQNKKAENDNLQYTCQVRISLPYSSVHRRHGYDLNAYSWEEIRHGHTRSYRVQQQIYPLTPTQVYAFEHVKECELRAATSAKYIMYNTHNVQCNHIAMQASLCDHHNAHNHAKLSAVVLLMLCVQQQLVCTISAGIKRHI